MIRDFLVAGVFLVSSLATSVHAQQATPPPYRGAMLEVAGVFVTPVPGAPFSATVQLESTVTMADGDSATRHSSATIARDSSGRIYNERRALRPAASDGESQVLSSHIFDPATRVSTFLNPVNRTARQQQIPSVVHDSDASAPTADNPSVKEEDLGTEVMQNLPVHGTRVSTTIPAAVAGTSKDIVRVVETWYSDELHMNMLTKSSDPRTGVQTLTITRVIRNDPDPAMFQVPAGYKLIDMNPAN